MSSDDPDDPIRRLLDRWGHLTVDLHAALHRLQRDGQTSAGLVAIARALNAAAAEGNPVDESGGKSH